MKYTWEVKANPTYEINFDEMYNFGWENEDEAEKAIEEWTEQWETNDEAKACALMTPEIKAKMAEDYRNYLHQRHAVENLGAEAGDKITSWMAQFIRDNYTQYKDLMTYHDFEEEIYRKVNDVLN